MGARAADPVRIEKEKKTPFRAHQTKIGRSLMGMLQIAKTKGTLLLVGGRFGPLRPTTIVKIIKNYMGSIPVVIIQCYKINELFLCLAK